MGTPSVIAMRLSDGYIMAIGCNWDGYLEPPGVGYTLLKHWTDPSKVLGMLALGDLSSLREEIGAKHSFDDLESHPTWNRYYMRDRGETDCHPTRYKTLTGLLGKANGYGARYVYLLEPDGWRYQITIDKTNVSGFLPLDARVIRNAKRRCDARTKAYQKRNGIVT